MGSKKYRPFSILPLYPYPIVSFIHRRIVGVILVNPAMEELQVVEPKLATAI